MGNVQATNLTNMAVNSFIDASSQIIQNAAATGDCFNDVTFDGCSNVHNININQSCYQKLNSDAFQKAKSSTDLSQTIEQTAEQTAKTISQNLNLNAGSTNSKNVINSVTNLGISIKDSIIQNCNPSTFAENSFTCRNSSGMSDIYVDQKIVSEIISSCGQDAETVQKATNDLKQTISQSASATMQDALLALLALILVVGLFIFGGGTKMIPPIVTKFIIPILFAYLYIFLQCKGWIPFVPNWCKGKKEKNIAYITLSSVLLLIIFFSVKKQFKRPPPVINQ